MARGLARGVRDARQGSCVKSEVNKRSERIVKGELKTELNAQRNAFCFISPLHIMDGLTKRTQMK